MVNLDLALREADIHLLLVDHEEFKTVNVNLKYLFDTKGLWQ